MAAGFDAGIRFFDSNHDIATSSGSFLSMSVCLLRSVRTSVVILALTPLTRSVIALPYAATISFLSTGVTLSAGCSFLSSFSNTQPLLAITPLVVKSSPTWILFWSSAATVSGPPTSSGLNDLKVNP